MYAISICGSIDTDFLPPSSSFQNESTGEEKTLASAMNDYSSSMVNTLNDYSGSIDISVFDSEASFTFSKF